jgi:hypothetical protein
MVYRVLMLIVVVAIVVAWRGHVDTKAMLRRMKADDERWAADRERARRLQEIRERLYLEGLSEDRRAIVALTTGWEALRSLLDRQPWSLRSC